eukprot:1161864-Pelagomonas_calceolata.AAC.1
MQRQGGVDAVGSVLQQKRKGWKEAWPLGTFEQLFNFQSANLHQHTSLRVSLGPGVGLVETSESTCRGLVLSQALHFESPDGQDWLHRFSSIASTLPSHLPCCSLQLCACVSSCCALPAGNAMDTLRSLLHPKSKMHPKLVPSQHDLCCDRTDSTCILICAKRQACCCKTEGLFRQ